VGIASPPDYVADRDVIGSACGLGTTDAPAARRRVATRMDGALEIEFIERVVRLALAPEAL
jgi:hypothetical protein